MLLCICNMFGGEVADYQSKIKQDSSDLVSFLENKDKNKFNELNFKIALTTVYNLNRGSRRVRALLNDLTKKNKTDIIFKVLSNMPVLTGTVSDEFVKVTKDAVAKLNNNQLNQLIQENHNEVSQYARDELNGRPAAALAVAAAPISPAEIPAPVHSEPAVQEELQKAHEEKITVLEEINEDIKNLEEFKDEELNEKITTILDKAVEKKVILSYGRDLMRTALEVSKKLAEVEAKLDNGAPEKVTFDTSDLFEKAKDQLKNVNLDQFSNTADAVKYYEVNRKSIFEETASNALADMLVDDVSGMTLEDQKAYYEKILDVIGFALNSDDYVASLFTNLKRATSKVKADSKDTLDNNAKSDEININ